MLALGFAPQGGAAWFTDVTERALPGVEITCGGAEKDWILAVNGGSVALADLDLDGDLDLVVGDGGDVEAYRRGEPGPAPRVYLNRGDGTFSAGEGAWALARGAAASFGAGLALGDLDGDGFDDLVALGLGPDRVFLNVRGEGLREVAPLPLSAGWSTSGALLDFDHDGVLDLAVTGYLAPELDEARRRSARWKGHAVMAGPQGLIPLHDRLYRGLGDGTFEDVSVAAGLRPDAAGYGLGVTTVDLDRDGWTDLYVANDSTPNQLWRNRGDGTFEELGFRLGLSHDASGREQAGMGIAVDDDAGMLFVTNFSGETNVLYARTASGRSFRERSARAGLAGPSLARLGWGTGFADFDLDGDQDLFVLNGHVYPEADRAGTDTAYAQPDQLFERIGERFVERDALGGAARVSRAGTCGDLDGDGDVDLVATVVDGPVRILRNDAPRAAGAAWLRVRPARGARARAVGARVVLKRGEESQVRELRTAGGFQAGLPLEAYFGIPAASEGRDAALDLEVHWPGGGVTTVRGATPCTVVEVGPPKSDTRGSSPREGAPR
ncbi:MAG: CRTAC1 family protein [Planctomycetota bacterium]